MSNALAGKTFLQILFKTPTRVVVRGWREDHPGWRARLAAAGLPVDLAAVISHVVTATNLWRGEKSAVAVELTAHFTDGLESGASVEDLVRSFGNERLAARLIQRAKRRNRPLLWHAWIFSLRATAGLILIYLVFLIRFCIGGPAPSVDYTARLNEFTLGTPASDRAWPLWRKAMLELEIGKSKGAAANDIYADSTPWPEKVAWLNQHASAIETARQASLKPSLGFVLGADGSAHDPELFPGLGQGQTADEPTICLLLPHLFYLSQMTDILSLDAKRAAESNDGASAQADLAAILSVARQLREPGSLLVAQMLAVGADSSAVRRLQRILSEHPSVFSDAQLIQLAHMLCGPRVAADIVDYSGERRFFDDAVQRIYTDDGNGDGRVTLKGARFMVKSSSPAVANDSGANLVALVFSVPMTTASRAEMQATYDRLLDQSEANLHHPLWQIDGENVHAQEDALLESPVGRIRYGCLADFFPNPGKFQATCERYLGSRDGTLVAIALELYHRQHGGYPLTLNDLTPELLPAVPADRITGEPVKYRLIDGEPVVYSVGVDRIDDGGKRPESKYANYRDPTAQ